MKVKMRIKVVLLMLILNTYNVINSFAQVPLVYEVENTGSACAAPTLPAPAQLPSYANLPDPFSWSNGSGRIASFDDWKCRRNEIKQEIERYEIGVKPPKPGSVTATYSGGRLTVVVTQAGQTLTLTSNVTMPTGAGPFPIVIGMNAPTGQLPANLFNGVIQIPFNHDQVVTYANGAGSMNSADPYFKLYPGTNIGKYSAWSWGISRLIDGIEIVKAQMNADPKRIAVTGCSYAGKMALFAGAFDERIALTIAQESGGGGVNSWRVSETIGNVEKIDNTNYSWFMQSMKTNFQGTNVSKLPHDHHELMAMIAPRALLVLGNPDYVWLGDESGYISCRAAQEVWKTFGVSDRFGFSFRGGHNHCSLPSASNSEVTAFVDKFLRNNTSANTNISVHSFGSTNYLKWIDAWDAYTLAPVTTNTPPTVSITSPANNATFAAPASITINATAADANGTVSNVQFYNGTTLIGSDATSPYSFVLANAAAGTYTLTARATDNASATTTSSPITVTVTGTTPTGPDPNLHIYLCFGQSNMEGQGTIETQDRTVDPRFQVMGAVNCTGARSFTIGQWAAATPPLFRCDTKLGPADQFGKTMVANLPTNIKVGIVPVAIAGCDIALFDKVNYASYVATAPSWMQTIISQYGGNPYARLVEVAKLAQKDGVIKGILMHQGETNNGQATWPAKVKAVYDNLINDLDLDPAKTPLLVGETVTTAQGGQCGAHNAVIATVPNVIPNSHIISASGLPPVSDNLHFTSASYRTLGIRYAERMLALLSPTANTSPTVSISSPVTGASFTAPASITINVNAADADGSITTVQFYNGSTLLGSDATSPYSFVWSNVPTGTYTLTARATDNAGSVSTSSAITVVVNPVTTQPTGTSGLAKCKGKYLANIIAGSVRSDFNTYWNGVTSENDCKWGSIERTRDSYNWAGADRAYNHAKNNGMMFRWHAIAWGSQYPTWIESLTPAQMKEEMEEYMMEIAKRYPNSIDQIDVLNESLRTHAPGTSFFRNGLGGLNNGVAPDRGTGYDWIVWLFRTARKHFPNSKLVLNDYGLENDQSAIREMLLVVKVLKDRGLIDGFGTQAHEFNINTLSASALKSSLDLMATGGVPIYVTELDISGDDATQRSRYQTLFPVYWEHPNVAGITLWGYVEGQTWKSQTGILNSNGTERPAMTWLKTYMAGRPDVSGCGTTTNTPPTVSITSPVNNATFPAPASITINATAADANGTVSNVQFYNGTTLLGSDASFPYSYVWANVAAGTYTITARATDNAGATTTSVAVTVTVTNPIAQAPYNGTAANIPGTIQAEEYDLGGQGVSFNELTTGNSGNATHRGDAVDLETTSDVGGGYNLGWATNGEWLEYTVNVTAAGTYHMDLRIAVDGTGRTLRVDMDGVNISGTVTLPSTAGYQTWQTVRVSNINLTAGQKVMRLTLTADYMNVNYIAFSSVVANVAPAVSITSPSNNESFTAPANIAINADATDADGSISSVSFYNGTTLLGTDATAPYSFAWNNVAAGTYTLTARATDNSGAITTSSGVTVVVTAPNTAPTVSIASPSNNATFNAPASITINVNAVDANGSISNVQFYNGTTLLGSDTSSPYSFVWTNVAAGTYNLTAIATDNTDLTGTSAIVTVVVNAPNTAPTINITSPDNNAIFTAPASITINADAADADGTISNVQFFHGATLLGSDATSPYSFTWVNAAEGTYTITAKATDDKGAVTTSDAITVAVNLAQVAGVTVQGEAACTVNGILNETFNAGFEGTGYLNTEDAIGAGATWSVNSPTAQTVSLAIRYAHATTAGRPMSLSVNGAVQVSNIAFASTGSGTNWISTNVQISLAAGQNTIALSSLTAEGSPYVDALTFASSTVSAATCNQTPVCHTEARPTASNFVVRNDWSDQNSGSGISNTSDALRINHRAWGRNRLWVIQSGKTMNVIAGQTYTISFDFRNDASNPVTSVDAGFGTSVSWDGPVLPQSVVAAPSGYSANADTRKSVTVSATTTGTVFLVFRLNWSGQPNAQVNTYLKNITVCTAATAALSAESFEVNYSVAPNPFESNTALVVKDENTVPMRLVISDFSGSVVYQSSTYNTNEIIQLGDNLKPGLYAVQAFYNGQVVTFRIMKN